MACSSSCATKDHATWGECVRAKAIRHTVAIPGNDYDPARSKSWDSELSLYRDARAQGIQPAGTKRAQIENAMKISDATGQAYQAG